MNDFGIALLWCALQVTLITAVAITIYAAFKRVGPLARSTVALTGLAVIVALSAFMLNHWPRWGTLSEVLDRAVNQLIADQKTDSLAFVPHPPKSHLPNVDIESIPDDFLDTQPQLSSRPDESTLEIAQPTDITNSSGFPPWRWPEIVAGLFLAGVAVGLVRLLRGLWAVSAYRRTSRPIKDPALLELLGVVQAELSCRRKIELRETSDLATAATIG